LLKNKSLVFGEHDRFNNFCGDSNFKQFSVRLETPLGVFKSIDMAHKTIGALCCFRKNLSELIDRITVIKGPGGTEVVVED